ncbi:hypothetical protein L7F22_065122 [Adiantum nelumboides]|nr:hypothetical protein [Adiantum nelumboides]
MKEFLVILYEKMENLFKDKRNVDVSGLLSDSFDYDNFPTGDEESDTVGASEGVDPLDANDPQTPSNQHTGEQSRCTGATKSTSTSGESSGLKRKRRERASTMKDVVESTRKLVSHMEVSEDRKDSRDERRSMVLLDIEARRSQALMEIEAARTATSLPVDLNDAWMEEDNLVQSSLQEFDSQLDDDCTGGFDAVYGMAAPSSTTSLPNYVADTMPNVVLQSPSGHNASLSSTMDNAKCRQKGLPMKEFPVILYEKMENLFRDKRNVDVSGLLSDSFDDDNFPTGDEESDTVGASEGVDPLDANDPQTPSNQHTGEQSRCTGATKATSTNGESSGLKRKRRERASTMMDVVESTRKLVSHMEVSEDRKDSRDERRSMVLLDIEARRSQALMEIEAARTATVREGGQALCNSIAYLGDCIKTLATPRGYHNGSQ